MRVLADSWHFLAVASASLTEKGNPLVLLTDGSAQMLHLELLEWVSLVSPLSANLPLACRLPTAHAGIPHFPKMLNEHAP